MSREPEFEFSFEIPADRLELVKKELLDYLRIGLNVRRNILYDPKRRVVRVVEWEKAPTASELAPEFRLVPIGRLIVTGCTIEDLLLAEPVRGIGLGKAIVVKLKEELQRRGCKEVWATRVAPEMREFWKKLSVRVVGDDEESEHGNPEEVEELAPHAPTPLVATTRQKKLTEYVRR